MKKKRIFFGDLMSYYSYAFSFSDNHDFIHQKLNLDFEKGHPQYFDSLDSPNLELILLSKHSNIQNDALNSLLDISSNDDILVYDLYHYLNSSFYDIIKSNLKPITDKLNLVLIDQNGESIFDNIDYEEEYKKLVNFNKNIYIISNRPFGESERVSTKNYILNLIYYFHYMSDNLNIHPQLPTPPYHEKKYDFITYLGLEDHSVKYWRQEILKFIDFNNKKIKKPRSFDYLKNIQNQVRKIYGYPDSNLGSYILFSIIESQDSKIKIVFENEYEEILDINKIFFTEKTLKCLIDEQPYFLFAHRLLRNELEKYGFNIPYPKSKNQIIKEISNICKEDKIDEWIDNNKNIFKTNKQRLYQLVYSSELPHIQKLIEWGLYDNK